jgi:hypothetical protein
VPTFLDRRSADQEHASPSHISSFKPACRTDGSPVAKIPPSGRRLSAAALLLAPTWWLLRRQRLRMSLRMHQITCPSAPAVRQLEVEPPQLTGPRQPESRLHHVSA